MLKTSMESTSFKLNILSYWDYKGGATNIRKTTRKRSTLQDSKHKRTSNKFIQQALDLSIKL